MSKISILDCTLRDGGYCNNWQFSLKEIKQIVNKLDRAKIEYIECGYLKDCNEGNFGTIYSNIKFMNEILPTIENAKIVCMINYGESLFTNIPYNDGSIFGIRVAFHRKDIELAFDFMKGLKQKGYEVFAQPMIINSYSIDDIEHLIDLCNINMPYAVYIVDSFGIMDSDDIINMYDLLDKRVNQSIVIGLHTHNNMQLSFSNAQFFLKATKERSVIIDATLYGMGRGAGNLNTELITEYLNSKYNKRYIQKNILSLVDDIYSSYYEKKMWGYSLPNYLSAKHKVHPNYASYLTGKKTLNVDDIDNILCLIDEEESNNYNERYIYGLYKDYMTKKDVEVNDFEELEKILKYKNVLVIAPGRSSLDEKEKIQKCIERCNVIVVSVNFSHNHFDEDYIFVSNLRKFSKLDGNYKGKIIATSNLNVDVDGFIISYEKLINKCVGVEDNATLMLIRLLLLLGAKKIYLAGLDGYSYDDKNNYISTDEKMINSRETDIEQINCGLEQVLNEYLNDIDIEWVTSPRNIKCK